jgi:hypothetical protein
MSIHIQWLTPTIGVLRAGKDFTCPPDDYDFSCVVTIEDTKAELIGGTSEVDSIFELFAFRHELRKLLKEKSVTLVIYDRYKSGQLAKHYEIKI